MKKRVSICQKLCRANFQPNSHDIPIERKYSIFSLRSHEIKQKMITTPQVDEIW